ncbi:DNA-directed RNA polymerase subunit alpha [Candidatus Falkowbacteria bacterium]|jgi:DNA-directed RNA polymerase subunit alpha|nr:DNA-directed RNA polymerase subunit alpha [Candidatus Falkowbacteria bacterium]
MENLLLPSKLKFEDDKKDKNKSTLTIEPLYFGYGTTLGNSLRRVLLSSLPGAAVTSVKIDGADQEFQNINDVKEDALEICLNLKKLRLRVHSQEPVKLTLSVKGNKMATAADFDKNSDVEIINPELEIAKLTEDKKELKMEVTVEQGRGYLPTEERDSDNIEIGNILIDSVFTPVEKVGYKVVPTRVGDITNYDKLIMEIETNGALTPKEAVEKSAKILIDHFSLLQGEESVEEVKVEKEDKE